MGLEEEDQPLVSSLSLYFLVIDSHAFLQVCKSIIIIIIIIIIIMMDRFRLRLDYDGT